MAGEKKGNPAVVGLAGFGCTTLLLQFHNVGWCGVGPVIALAFMFGGLAQLVAGLQEYGTGNNYGYAAFSTYGAFWIALGIVLIMNHFGIYKSGKAEVGWFLVTFTVITVIYWIGSWKINGALAWTFTTLVIGFILLDLAHFGFPGLTKVAGYELMVCALLALYVMTHIIFADLWGRDVVPVGKPWLKKAE